MTGNRLSEASSPYLLQHADNPVHWREWGDAAFDDARARGVPVLLSIGYAACHWCHVMAHESFEDVETASLMNALYVNIKVDREERPDVDHIYMTALHGLGQQGGWPLTMFLDAEGAPFWGGTYFPNRPRFGRPSFRDVLRQVADVFAEQPARVRANAEALTEAVRAEPGPDGRPVDLAGLGAMIARAMDPVEGGLRGAPKFPNAPLLDCQWRADAAAGAGPSPLVTLTLRRMCQGGIYDQIGGGFARYSTDETWLVPHFEKMLSDNAQLLKLLAMASCVTGEALFTRCARDTVAWLAREMTLPDGAFAASLDADSDGVEGRFYIWTRDEIVDRLGLEDATFLERHLPLTPNWRDERTDEPVVILTTRDTDVDDADSDRLAGLRRRLLDARETRRRPTRDDKALADWNGLTIAALANASRVYAEPSWLAMAVRAFDATVVRLQRDGWRLGHSSNRGVAIFPGLASDYASMALAALALYEATFDARHADAAERWVGALLDHHATPDGGLFSAADDAGRTIARLAPTQDDATPNPHGQTLEALTRLEAIRPGGGWGARADRLATFLEGRLGWAQLAHGSVAAALIFREHVVSVVVAGTEPESLLAAAMRLPFWSTVLVRLSAEAEDAGPVSAAQRAAAGRGGAFVCKGGRCSPMITDPAALAAAVAEG